VGIDNTRESLTGRLSPVGLAKEIIILGEGNPSQRRCSI
jgi:hypothetical protein